MASRGVTIMSEWLLSLPDQIRGAVAEADRTGWPRAEFLPASGSKPRVVFLEGMGGSAMAARLAAAILSPNIDFPLVVQADPELPRWVDGETPVVIVSYSGDTWESVKVARAARERGLVPWIIAGGGALEAQSSEGRFFRAELGMAPRAALGWTLTPTLLLLGRLAGRSLENDLLAAADLLQAEADEWQAGGGHAGREPVALARFLVARTPFFATESEVMRPLATRWRCQLHENAKRFAGEIIFPESVHNEIEGWADQAKLESPSVFLLEGPEKARGKRAQVIEAARRELESLGMDFVRVPARGDGRLERVLSQVFLGDLVSLELARLSGVDPVRVEAIDRLKRVVLEAPPVGGEEDR